MVWSRFHVNPAQVVKSRSGFLCWAVFLVLRTGTSFPGGKKMEDPHSLKSNEMAQCSFQPQQPLVCDTFKNCEGLSRVAFMDGNGVVMLGKVISCERKEEGDKGGKKK